MVDLEHSLPVRNSGPDLPITVEEWPVAGSAGSGLADVAWTWACAFFKIASLATLLALGGSTLVPDTRTIPFVVWLILGGSIATWRVTTYWRDFPLALIALAFSPILLGVMQVLPVPVDLLSVAPGQSVAVAVRALVSPQSSATISVDRLATTLAALQIAVFSIACLLFHRVRFRQRKVLYALFAAMGAISAIISATQYVSGGTAFDFYNSAHASYAPGFFANRNHGAIFLGCCLTFFGTLINCQRLPAELKLGVFFAAAVPVLAIIALSGSRAGLVISGMMALSVVLLMPRSAWAMRHSKFPNKRLPGLAAISIVGFLALVALIPLSGDTALRLTAIDSDLRWSIWERSLVLAGQYMPWGSGLGTFPATYAMIEPLTELQPFYINHVHNDWIEAFVETGIMALIPLAAGVVLAAQGMQASRVLDPIRRMECQAGLIVTFGLLVHSLIDYPLRTPTLALTFAFALTLISSAIRASRAV